MDSRKLGGNTSRDSASDPSFKGKGTLNVSGPSFDQLNSGISNMSLDSAQDDGWEVPGKKSKNKGGGNASRQRGPHSNSEAWNPQDTMQKQGMINHGGAWRGSGWPIQSSDSRKPAGRGYAKPQSAYQNPDVVIPPPLKDGWRWSDIVFSSQSSEDSLSKQHQPTYSADDQISKVNEVDDSGESDEDIDDTDDELLDDDFESDGSQKSHETRKKNRWFRELFECLDGLSVEQINDLERQWHCPACKGGPGAIDWYQGLQPLIAHARTVRSKKVKLHRELAELLEEEIQRRGTSAVAAGEVFGKWKGLGERADKLIVWPPMVVIMNTRLEKDDNDKWLGMGNQELLDYFGSYSALKARHSYGPQGHRGMSLLIFESSAVGFMEAERLAKHFEDNNKDRLAWEKNRVPFYPGGKRQLYGYMAEEQDLDNFNQHSRGKTRLKYEMRSYQEMVVNQMRQMSEDNQQLIFFKNKVAKEQLNKKVLVESYSMLSEKLRQTMEENRVVKLRTKKHHEQNKEEMDYQESFFREQMQKFYDDRDAKEEKFERVMQDQREKVAKSEENAYSAEERQHRAEEVAKFIKLQDKDMEDFVKEREKLMEAHRERRAVLMRKHRAEMTALEEEFDSEFNRLIEKYTPN
ncbi:protein SUPPRESSOR OF protein 3 [Dorcoceras hygrometricum]|uniref:Protein SUPPRESSOR OF protein 3 n=1 Tax=Dorcoceras hygrometricum TaxID=472368 RepID=A0A2Z7BIH9_9LAMI|nr:protein SUPPRESSOR OF protein 3 [Dorcoceras hygrometricum]